MRQILCLTCFDRWKLHPKDITVGIVAVKQRLTLSADGDFGTEFGWKCDICDKDLVPGDIAGYVGAFQPDSKYAERDGNSWRNFGKPLSDDEFHAIQTLTKDAPCHHSPRP